ncbi:MAG: transglycosylase SLT domain-containing protein [Methylotenera sp.]|uniref:transglycosylase SLT domain-containing protein n=1 Tax=Methylotenera sp. TaxID=2051956 RepID=UPI0017F5192B|nr:transglycosylase SLT domain-containing protein [Methylotenera sp.]NOU25741.1 transglycosylase SLT domain-containing protein [Methylotenera sp.]
MFQPYFLHAYQFLSRIIPNSKFPKIKHSNPIHLPAVFKVRIKPLILSLICLSSTTANIVQAESNVAGEEIIIHSDDSFRPQVRDLGTLDKQEPKNTENTELGDAFDRELHVDLNDLAEQVPVKSDDLWQRIRNGYAMPDSTSSLVTHHEEWYSSRPDYIKRMVERSQRYLFHIVEEVEKRGMPTEIALLPMIESAYNPQANSTSNASGIWQFIPSTGKHFGLKQNWWVDNRRNVTFATDAALAYLQKLYNMFGAWDLALAAYNAGEGTVGRAIERNRKLGLPIDYESIDLPAETRNYVPKLQAIKNLMTNPENYGLKIQTIANTPYFAKVIAPAQIDAHLAAKLAEISDDEFLALNPSNKRPVIANEGEKHELLLPILAAQAFRNNLANYDKPLVSWRTYFAKRGERMENIASKFGIQLAKLRNVNNLPTQNKIKKSATILVPNGNNLDVKTSNGDSGTQKLQPSTNAETSTNQESANLDLSALNNAYTESNTVNEKDEIEPVEQRNVSHKVKKGETLQGIAQRYNVTVKQIKTVNSIKRNRVKVGQIILIKTENTQSNRQKKSAKSNSNSNSNKTSVSNNAGKKIKSARKTVKNKAVASKKKHRN